MKNTPKLSIIVPIYNTEAYLPRCIESLLVQTFTNFEILLIDDGSPDKSGKICDEYAKKDARIRVFHKENGGVSSARNLGIDNAKGEWISFIDSDDWVSLDFYNADEFEEDCDVIQKSYAVIDEFEKKITNTHYVKPQIIRSWKKFSYFYIYNRTNTASDKLFRRSIIKDYRFNESIKIGEDFLFTFQFITTITCYKLSPNGKYFYRKRNGSAMSSVDTFEKKCINDYKIMEELEKLAVNNKLRQLSDNIIYGQYVMAFISKKYYPLLNYEQKEKIRKYIDEFSLKKISQFDILRKTKKFCLVWKFKITNI